MLLDIRKKLHKRKGYAPVSLIVSVLALVLCWYLLIQFMEVGNAFSYISQTNSYVTRTIGAQGGIKGSEPAGFPEDEKYITNRQLYATLEDGFANAGFTSWKITINGKDFTKTRDFVFKEKEKIEIKIHAEMDMIIRLTGGDHKIKIDSERIIFSSFTERQYLDDSGLV